MKIRRVAFVSVGLAMAAGVTAVALITAKSSAGEIPYGEFLQYARSGSIDRAMIVGDKVSAVVDGKERFAMIPKGELDLASRLTRAGINLDIKNSH